MTEGSRSSRLTRLAVGVVVALSAVLVYSALIKVQTIDVFASDLKAHRLVPESWAFGGAWTVVVIEAVVGVVGIAAFGSTRRLRLALLLVGLVFLGFASYSSVLVVRPPPKPVPCGCGLSRKSVESWTPIAARNLALAGVCVVLSRSRRLGVQPVHAASSVTASS